MVPDLRFYVLLLVARVVVLAVRRVELGGVAVVHGYGGVEVGLGYAGGLVCGRAGGRLVEGRVALECIVVRLDELLDFLLFLLSSPLLLLLLLLLKHTLALL